MGLSATMQIGMTGLSVYRTATDVTSENIANVNTPGYSRQRVILESGFPMGTGVQIAAVERYYDALLQKQLMSAQTTQGYDTTKSTVLQQIEPNFNEVATDGLGAAISNLFGAWQDVTLNPAGSAERQTVIARAQILVDNFHSVSKNLSDTQAMQNATLVPVVQDINATLTNIAQLNGQIKTTELVSGNANAMRDQRDQLIRDLSQQIGISTTENADGTTDVSYADGGAALVTGSRAGSFSLTPNVATGFYDVNLTPAGGATAAIVAPLTGQLGATVNLRDTIIPGYLSQLDTLAATIATQVNTQHAAGYDLNGVAGLDFFAATSTTAATIALNPLVGINQIAASGSATLKGDNSNALKLAQLQNIKTMPPPPGTPNASFNNYFNDLVSQVGLDVLSSKNTVAQNAAFVKQLTTLRESNSGVSLDEELTNLVKYQRSYQASAKLITTATDMMDVVLGMIR